MGMHKLERITQLQGAAHWVFLQVALHHGVYQSVFIIVKKNLKQQNTPPPPCPKNPKPNTKKVCKSVWGLNYISSGVGHSSQEQNNLRRQLNNRIFSCIRSELLQTSPVCEAVRFATLVQPYLVSQRKEYRGCKQKIPGSCFERNRKQNYIIWGTSYNMIFARQSAISNTVHYSISIEQKWSYHSFTFTVQLAVLATEKIRNNSLRKLHKRSQQYCRGWCRCTAGVHKCGITSTSTVLSTEEFEQFALALKAV